MNTIKVAATILFSAVLVLSGCSDESAEKESQQVANQKIEKTEESVEAQPEAQKKEQAPVMSPLVKEGVDYSVIAEQDASEEPVVYEFFSYTCPHCYNLEPVMLDWKKNYKSDQVSFRQIPVFIPQVEHLTYGFYTAETLGGLEEVHANIFNEWHGKKNIIRTKEQLVPIFQTAGVSKSEFEETYASAEVEAKVAEAKALMNQFQVTSFPLLIVNEKYKVMSYQNLQELLGHFAINNTK